MAHPIVGFEISAGDAAALGAFYSALFGWSVVVEAGGEAVEVDTNGGTGLTGRIVTAAVGSSAAVCIRVPDLTEALGAVAAAGGSVASGGVEAPPAASARFADPAGNMARLVSTPAARPSPGTGAPVTYVEVFGPGLFGPAGLLAFYTEVFGWAPLHGQTGDVAYVQVDPGRGGDVVAAIGDDGRHRPRVVLYAAVPELDPYCDKASALGGTVAVPPTDVGSTVQFAHLTDPQGTTVGAWRTRSG